MGERVAFRVYKGPDQADFRAICRDVLQKAGGSIDWNEPCDDNGIDCRINHCGTVHTVQLPYLSGSDYLFCKLLGMTLSCPWIELRVQEGSLWDCVTYSAGEILDTFSVSPEYWSDDRSEWEKWKGNASVVAQAWGIPTTRIDRYFQNWQPIDLDEDTFEYQVKGKAYEADEFEYGDIWQSMDFLRVLGGRDPSIDDHDWHRLRLPELEVLKSLAEKLTTKRGDC